MRKFRALSPLPDAARRCDDTPQGKMAIQMTDKGVITRLTDLILQLSSRVFRVNRQVTAATGPIRP